MEEPSDHNSDINRDGDGNEDGSGATQIERDSGSGAAKFRSGWTSTPKVPRFQSFVPATAPRETEMQRRKREETEENEAEGREREKEARLMAAAEEEAARLERERRERERLAAEEDENQRLERERFATLRQAELERLEAEKVAKLAELGRLEQKRIEQEKELAEQRIAAAAAPVASPVGNIDLEQAEGNNNLDKAEEGVTHQSSSFMAAVEQEEKEEGTLQQATWWQQNKCRCSGLLLLLLVVGAVAGIVSGLMDGDNDEESASSVVGMEGDADGTIPLIVDRTCEYRKGQTVYVNAVTNGVNNQMSGGIYDFDGNNAVVVSHIEGSGALWALSKNGRNWEQASFQTDEEDQFGWDIAMRGNRIVVGAPGYGGSSFFHPKNEDYVMWGGRGTALVMAKDSSGTWDVEAYLSPDDADYNAKFGASVDISDCGCYIAIGAWHDKGSRGSVYVFSKTSSGSWTQVQKLSPSTRQSQSDFFHGNFGHTVAITDTMLAVKAPFDYINGIRGVVHIYQRGGNDRYEQMQRLSTPEGPQTEAYHSPQVLFLDGFLLVGSHEYRKVYVFKQNGAGSYQKVTELTASDASPGSSFGVKIGGWGTDVLVADRGDDSSYLFSYEDGAWKEKAKFNGYHAALSGNSIVVHSPFEFRLNGNRYGGDVSFYDLVCEAS